MSISLVRGASNLHHEGHGDHEGKANGGPCFSLATGRSFTVTSDIWQPGPVALHAEHLEPSSFRDILGCIPLSRSRENLGPSKKPESGPACHGPDVHGDIRHSATGALSPLQEKPARPVCRASGPACHGPEFHGHIRRSATGGRSPYRKSPPNQRVGQAALLATGRSFTVTSGVWQPGPVALTGKARPASV